MQRNEAISYLREIQLFAGTVSPEAVTLEEPKGSYGYKVRIKGAKDTHPLAEIAKKRNLAFRKEKDEMVIYRER